MTCVVALAALPAPSPGQVLSFSVKADLVVFSATAVDGKGRPVTNLRREDFRVYDEGRAKAIAHFHGGLGLPARVLILLDASGSMGGKDRVANARQAASQLLLALSPEDEVAVAGFDSRYWGVVPRRNVRGRPLFVYYSYVPGYESDRPVSFLTDIRWRRLGHWIK